MVRLGDREIVKEKFYAVRGPIKVWDANVDNIVISKLVQAKTNFKYLIGYLDKAIKPLVLVMAKMSGYVKIFKVKEGNNKLISFRIDNEGQLKKYKSIWTKIKDLKKIKLNALRVYDGSYIKPKIRTCGGKVYSNFRDLNVPEDYIKWESFTVVSIDFLSYTTRNIICKYI